jgi:hypothetical protein
MTTSAATLLANPTLPLAFPPLVGKLLDMKGQIVSLGTVRELKVRKGETAIQKASVFSCRAGVSYDNIKAVKEKRENGELPEVNQGLNWGEWAVFPHLIHHKGEFYFRCNTLPGNIPKVAYQRNGAIITKEEAQVAALASEFRDHEDTDVFTIKVSSIKEINGERV